MFTRFAKHRVIKRLHDTKLAISSIAVLTQSDKANHYIAAAGTHGTGRIDVKVYLVAAVHYFRHGIKAAPKAGDQIKFYLLQRQVNITG